jgi:lipopolysaccharide transport system ATP-binding protein
MTLPIIEIESLGKKYQIGANREKYLSIRDQLAETAHGFLRRFKAKHHHIPSTEDFWALKDVSFSVKQGEAVGIIGRNGAGKSTLLKVLSQITPPSEGKFTCRGRIASLLEVGTGFHPELTGRENIYLNGAILGMTRAEIRRNFDEIVAFAEIDKFLDTPVKRYSSGMYVRLAFAVAAHLEPEILVIDEVLAVGDVRFQVKCIGKMGEVSKSGRTVLFVSHNMGTVLQLCGRGVVLTNGRVTFNGTADAAVARYMEQPLSHSGTMLVDSLRQLADKKPKDARFVRVTLLSGNGTIADTFHMGETMTIKLDIAFERPVVAAVLSFIVRTAAGGNIYHCVSRDAQFLAISPHGDVSIAVTFPRIMLYPGSYVIDDVWLATADGEQLDYVRDVLGFYIDEGGSSIFRRLAREKAVVHEVPTWKIV